MSNGGSGVETKRLAAWIAPFRTSFTAPTWRHVLVLVTGALLVPGRRTVASALRVLGLAETPQFTNYHRVLNRDRWCSRSLSRCLLQLLVAALVPDGPVVVGLDDTIERRWGAKIRARGIYRDPVRSSHGHFVKASGLRWLCIMLLPEIAWAGRVWALPFLTALAPSERHARESGRRHKKLTDWADRSCCKPLAGCRTVVLSVSPIAASPRSTCSTPCARGFAWSPGCGLMPACSIHHPRGDPVPLGALRPLGDAIPPWPHGFMPATRAGAVCG
jgi:hypothetical protein